MTTDVMIHVNFENNGTVSRIGELPAGLSGQEWFDKLTRVPNNHFQALAGGRGVFKIPADLLGQLRSNHLIAAGNA